MAEKEQVAEHKNIYVALAAFQGENPKILKNKRFGKEGEGKSFMYADLDSILDVVRPLTSKHGLAITFEGEGEQLICALYHSSHGWEETGNAVEKITDIDGNVKEVVTPMYREVGVLRSLPIGVIRKGQKQPVGEDSTYARKYTLSEVLGIASEEDLDTSGEKRTKNLEDYAFRTAKTSVEKTKVGEALDKQIKFLKKELYIAELVEKGEMPKGGVEVEDTNGVIAKAKVPQLGLKADQYKTLIKIGEERKSKGEVDEPTEHPAS